MKQFQVDIKYLTLINCYNGLGRIFKLLLNNILLTAIPFL